MVEKKPILSVKQRNIAKLKAEGKKLKEIAAVEYPQAKEHSGEVLVSRELNKPHVAQYVAKELSLQLEEYGITKNQYLENLGLAMQAMRSTITGEIVVDYTTRLQANKMAERFIKFEDDTPPTPVIYDPNMDEIELARIYARKS